MILGLRFNKNLFALIHLSQELLPGAITYSSIIFIGAIFAAVYNYESAILRAHGNSVIPLLFLILSAILNVVLDFVFCDYLSYGNCWRYLCNNHSGINLLFIMLYVYEEKIRYS